MFNASPARVLNNIVTMAMFVLAIDMVGFMSWIGSGQVPPDSIYVGTLTAHIIKFIFGI